MIDESIYSLEVLFKDAWVSIFESFDENKVEQKKAELIKQGYKDSDFRISNSKFETNKKWNDN